MKKRFFTAAVVLCFALLLSGCSALTNILNPIPQEYTEGVKVPREYPDDDLEIYDDATVFEVDEDDEEIKLTYGTEDDMDDVIDFFEDLFEDNDLIIDEQEDDKDEFYAKGSGDGFEFEIEAAEAKGDPEERLFKTVVEVNVEFTESADVPVLNPQETAKPAENNLIDNVQGFWHACGSDGEISDAFRMEGVVMDISNNSIDMYSDFVLAETAVPFEIIGENQIKYNTSGTDYIWVVDFEKVNGIDVMSFTSNGSSIYFEKSNYFDFMDMAEDLPQLDKNDVVYLGDNLSDSELEFYAGELLWYCSYYMYNDGTYEETEYDNNMFLFSDYTGYEELDGGYEEITWYIWDGYMYITYEDKGELYWPVDYECDGELATLYFYDEEEGYEGGAWIYSVVVDGTSNNNNTAADHSEPHYDLTDAEWMEILLEGEWTLMFKANIDGSRDYDTDLRILNYLADNTADYNFYADDEYLESNIGYTLSNGMLTYTMNDGKEYLYYLFYMEEAGWAFHYLSLDPFEVSDGAYVYGRMK